MKLRPVPRTAWFATLAVALITAAAVSGQHWVEATGGDDSGILYPVLVAIVPVFSWIGVGIINGSTITRRARTRQNAALVPEGWVKRVFAGFWWTVILFLLAVALIGILWLLADIWISRQVTGYTGAGDEYVFPRTVAIVFGVVFAPGLTAALPSILVTASAPDPDDD